MKRDKIFACQRCDAEMEIQDVFNTDTTLCHQCGQEYRLQFVRAEEAYELIPIEPVEEGERPLAEQEEDEPFQVLREPAATREDDSDRY